jgi:putative PIN family toxin of toxin-antitoxin system
MRAVLDTNVVVSGVIKKEGPSGQVLGLFLEQQKFIAVTSLDILAEIRAVLGRTKIRKYHAWTDEQIEIFVAFLYTQSIVTPGNLIVNVITTDLDDNKLLACAREGNADCLVTGDGDLLQLDTYEGTRILRPAAFLALLKSA